MYPFQNNGKRVSSTWVDPEMLDKKRGFHDEIIEDEIRAVEAIFRWLKGSRAFSKFWFNSKPLQAFWVKKQSAKHYPDISRPQISFQQSAKQGRSKIGAPFSSHGLFHIIFTIPGNWAIPKLVPYKELGQCAGNETSCISKERIGYPSSFQEKHFPSNEQACYPLVI